VNRYLADALAEATAGPRLDEPLPPVLTPTTWREYKAEHLDAFGDYARHLRELERHPARSLRERWFPGHALGPRTDAPAHWPTIHGALEAWADLRDEGHSAPALGFEPVVQTSPGILRDSRTHRLADALVYVDQALHAAHAADEVGLPWETWVGILVARLVGVRAAVTRRRLEGAPAAVPVPAKRRARAGARVRVEVRREGQRVPVPAAELAEALGLELAAVGLVVRRGKAGLEVELGARNLVPLPPPSSPRRLAALRRREALLRRR
jgi:hypothetical protein